MGSEGTWLVSFDATRAPLTEHVTRALASIPLAKLDVAKEGSWVVRVGRGDFAIGLSNEDHVLAESQELAERADGHLAAILARANARYEILFDLHDHHWFADALELASVRLAALSDGVVYTHEDTFHGSISNRPTTLGGARLDAVRATARERFAHASDDEITIEDVLQPFFGRFRIVDVTCTAGEGERFHAAVDEDARVLVLSGSSEGLGAVTKADPPATLDVPWAASLYALDAAFWTSTPGTFTRVVTSMDDIAFHTRIDDAQRANIAAAKRELGPLVGPTKAERRGDGWCVTSWFLEGDSIMRREVDVSRTGELATRDAAAWSALPMDVFTIGGITIF